MSHFARNVARVLRSDVGGDMMAIPTIAIVIATIVVTAFVVHDLEVAFVVGAASFPLQLLAFANEFAGYAVASVGSFLVGTGTALVAGSIIAVFASVPVGVILGVVGGGFAGWLVFRTYARFLRALHTEAPEDWY